MRFVKGTFPNPPRGLNVTGPQYRVGVTDAQVAVSATPPGTSILGSAQPGRVYLIELRNSSPAGQRIRVSYGSPSFTGPNGMLLQPGDTMELAGWALPLSALSDVAGGLLDVLVAKTGP